MKRTIARLPALGFYLIAITVASGFTSHLAWRIFLLGWHLADRLCGNPNLN